MSYLLVVAPLEILIVHAHAKGLNQARQRRIWRYRKNALLKPTPCLSELEKCVHGKDLLSVEDV